MQTSFCNFYSLQLQIDFNLTIIDFNLTDLKKTIFFLEINVYHYLCHNPISGFVASQRQAKN